VICCKTLIDNFERVDLQLLVLEKPTQMVANPNLWAYNEVAGKVKEDTQWEMFMIVLKK
jgi:hypothetical protein